ncbi:MAG: agmatine deiminase [Butyrivibrio sp.]|nr:agmatine deiminase [Butyrivibrio sp.]
MKVLHDFFPAEDGFYMPAEYEKHLGTLMIYPTRSGSWGLDRKGALYSFGRVFLEILKREELFLIAGAKHYNEAAVFMDKLIHDNCSDPKLADLLSDRCHIINCESDDSWARDVGPTFLRDDKRNVRGVDWAFNAWGGEVDGLYASWDKDDKLAGFFCDYLDVDSYDAHPFVLEGGSIHSDGEGTVMVTKSCLLSKGRNPALSQDEIENLLKKYLGAKKVLWLPRGIYNDETNEHVDNVCAFIRPGEVILATCDDKDDPQYELSGETREYLESVTDAQGRKLKIHELPIPDHPVFVSEKDLLNYEFEEGEDMREAGERLAASYVNFYFVNGAVLVPQFGGENDGSDKRALSIMEKICTDREVIGIPARDILLGGGNIHCITQQIPMGSK